MQRSAPNLSPIKDSKVLPWLDITTCFNEEPAPLDFVLPGLVAGTVGGLVSPGGVGKSTFALEAAIEIACADMGAGLLELGIERHGKVTILAAEDPIPALRKRLYEMAKCLKPGIKDIIAENLCISPCSGLGADLLESDWQEAIFDAADGSRLLVIDTLTRFHSLDENSGADAKQIMSKLEAIALRSGAAIVYLHHVSKAAGMSGMTELQQAARGSSVFVDNARWLSFVSGMSQEEALKFGIPDDQRRMYVRWNISKQNYGQPIPDRWFKRHDGGVLLPADLATKGSKAPQRSGKDF
jgi:RecA-family ATPase